MAGTPGVSGTAGTAGVASAGGTPYGEIAGTASTAIGSYLESKGKLKGIKSLDQDAKQRLTFEQDAYAENNARFDQTLDDIAANPRGQQETQLTTGEMSPQIDAANAGSQAGGAALGINSAGRAATMSKLLPIIRARSGDVGAAEVARADDTRMYELSEDLRRLEGRRSLLRSLAPAKTDIAAMAGGDMRVGGQFMQMAGKSASGE